MKPVRVVLAAVGGALLAALLWKELPAASRYLKMQRM
jgi:hypothetical protein